ncbi:MAG: alkaline phosphatase family protein, partial [Coriobacteriia bacterium]|nr:alkaline phosphatase family protein [Coriobacteriia bacterium]
GGRTVVVSAPDDFEMLYGASRAQASYFRPWGDGDYMTSGFIDQAIALTERVDPQLVVVHLPDADETAHDSGADSKAYADVVASIDRDIARLVAALQDERTTYVICADHGHIPTGGHGGWERDVTRTPAVFVGSRTLTERGEMSQSDIAPTVAAILGLPIPKHSAGRVRGDLLADSDAEVLRGEQQFRVLAERYATVIGGMPPSVGGVKTYDALQLAMDDASAARLSQDRQGRLPVSLAIFGVALLIVATIGISSWRALVASLAGAVAYFGIYNGLYFLVHGYKWSLSAFNTETFVEMFFNIRMAEAALSVLIAAGVSAYVYPLMRRSPKGPKADFLAGWLALGPATALCVLALLAVQVAWFLWAWGAEVTWRLPDLKWGFKYDLDL